MTEKQLVTELREELRKAREAVQLVKEAAEAEKQAAYTLGVEETQARLTEELTAICRDYCDISWGKALNAAGVPVGFNLRRPESIYYDPEICELPGPDSFHPEQAIQVSAQSKADQVPPAPSEVPKDSNQMVAKEKRLKLLRVRIKIRIRRKILLIPQRKPQILLLLSSAKLLTQWSPRQKLRLGDFIVFVCFMLLFSFLRNVSHFFIIINEDIFLLFHTSL